ncbi:unnamed protein product [Larinioides sclopetarius]|uniref:Uncharacterized protein n=1 Tax=Larinioides sclopetarius TaxID=280406 RepID=A0AAV2AAL3_9ARAC
MEMNILLTELNLVFTLIYEDSVLTVVWKNAFKTDEATLVVIETSCKLLLEVLKDRLLESVSVQWIPTREWINLVSNYSAFEQSSNEKIGIAGRNKISGTSQAGYFQVQNLNDTAVTSSVKLVTFTDGWLNLPLTWSHILDSTAL